MTDYGTVISTLATSNVNTSGIPIDMEAKTKVLSPKNYTTRALVRLFGKTIICDSMEHKYRERRPIPNWTTVSATSAAASTTLNVTDPSYIKNDHMMWIIRNGVILDQVLVQDGSIDSSVTIIKFTGTTATGGLTNATAVGDIVIIGSEAHAEGEAVPAAYTNISVDKTDFLMQIDRPVKKTDIEANQGHYDSTEKALARDLQLAWIEENAKINLAMYLGAETKDSTSGDGTRYAIDGLWNRLTENIENFTGVGAGFTLQALQEALRKTIDNAPAGGKKVLCAGVNINNNISSWPESAIRVNPSSKKWGIQIREVETQYGSVAVAYDNVLSARFGMADRGAILDSSNLRQMHLRGLKLKAYYNITANRDIHNMEHAISGTYGLQSSAIESMSQLKGVE